MPAEWHAWLHYATDSPLPETWQASMAEVASSECHGYADELSPARPRLSWRSSSRGGWRL